MSLGRLDAWVRRWWRGEAGWVGRMASVAFLPGEWLFRWGAAARNLLFDTGAWPARAGALPVLSVGNLTVGGTGKTPLVRWFVGALAAAGAAPAVVARGYGRDELLLHRRWFPRIPVVAHPDRVLGVERAAAAGADVAVLDDGFQHRPLRRRVDVVLLAAETPFPGRRLPRGPYREGPAALARAHLAIVTRKTATADEAEALAREIRARRPGLPVARVALVPSRWEDLEGRPVDAPAGPAVVLTAVAQPEGVRELAARRLARTPASLDLAAFPDHHEFSSDELRSVTRGGRALVVTEKDAVKLAERRGDLAGVPVHVLALEVVWEDGEAHAADVVDRVLAARPAGDRGAGGGPGGDSERRPGPLPRLSPSEGAGPSPGGAP